MELPEYVTVPRTVIEFLLTGSGPRYIRRQMMQLLLVGDVTTKVDGWTVLSFVVYYGGDRNLPLVEDILRMGPHMGEYQYRGGRSLLGMVYSTKNWRRDRRKLVKLLSRYGESELSGAHFAGFVAEDVKFLLHMGIRVTRNDVTLHLDWYPNSFSYRERRQLYAMGLLAPNYLKLVHLHDVTIPANRYSCEPKTPDELKLCLRREYLPMDEYGLVRYVNHKMFSSVEITSDLLDFGLSPCILDGSILDMRVPGDVLVSVARRFPELLSFISPITGWSTLREIVRDRNFPVIRRILDLQPPPQEDLLGWFVANRQIHCTKDLAGVVNVVRYLADVVPEKDRADILKRVREFIIVKNQPALVMIQRTLYEIW